MPNPAAQDIGVSLIWRNPESNKNTKEKNVHLPEWAKVQEKGPHLRLRLLRTKLLSLICLHCQTSHKRKEDLATDQWISPEVLLVVK